MPGSIVLLNRVIKSVTFDSSGWKHSSSSTVLKTQYRTICSWSDFAGSHFWPGEFEGFAEVCENCSGSLLAWRLFLHHLTHQASVYQSSDCWRAYRSAWPVPSVFLQWMIDEQLSSATIARELWSLVELSLDLIPLLPRNGSFSWPAWHQSHNYCFGEVGSLRSQSIRLYQLWLFYSWISLDLMVPQVLWTVQNCFQTRDSAILLILICSIRCHN